MQPCTWLIHQHAEVLDSPADGSLSRADIAAHTYLLLPSWSSEEAAIAQREHNDHPPFSLPEGPISRIDRPICHA